MAYKLLGRFRDCKNGYVEPPLPEITHPSTLSNRRQSDAGAFTSEDDEPLVPRSTSVNGSPPDPPRAVESNRRNNSPIRETPKKVSVVTTRNEEK